MTDARERWEALAEELEASDPAIARSTMMGLPCLRLGGAFFASLDTRSDALIIKLSSDEVAARVADGSGRSFAPAGRTFREWVVIVEDDDPSWRSALEDALAFVRASTGDEQPA